MGQGPAERGKQKEVLLSRPPAKRSFMEAETLTAEQAEGVVDELIEAFGPGAYPKVSVTEVAPGTWRIQWRSMEVRTSAMTADEWRDWLRRRVGSIAPERLETSEG